MESAILLDHDYKEVYLRALDLLSDQAKKRGLRILEFGCGGGMNLLHLMSVLNRQGIRVEQAIGTDFSPVLIEAAQRDAKNFVGQEQLQRLEFHQAKNESLLADLSARSEKREIAAAGRCLISSLASILSDTVMMPVKSSIVRETSSICSRLVASVWL